MTACWKRIFLGTGVGRKAFDKKAPSPYHFFMQCLFPSCVLLFAAAPLVCAGQEQANYDKLLQALTTEVTILHGITDEASAGASLKQLEGHLRGMAQLRRTTDETALWRYIDNTPDIKAPLVEQIELLFVELQRIEKARFFRCVRLYQLLRAQVTPASSPASRRPLPSAAKAPAGKPTPHP